MFPEDDEVYRKIKELKGKKITETMETLINAEILQAGREEKILAAKIEQELEFIKQETQKNAIISESEAIAIKMQQEGNSHDKRRAFEVAAKLAENKGVGDMATTGVALGTISGMATGVGGMMANIATDVLRPINASNDVNYMSDSTDLPMLSVVDEDRNGLDDFQRKVDKLKMMKDAGLLTDAEFAEEKQRMLNEL